MEHRIKILAIDDQQDNLDIIKAVMDYFLPNYKIFYALSGEEGIKIAHSESPDIILLDILMPGLDGFEVCKRIKENEKTANITIMMLSATGNKTETRIKGLELGADTFLAKPYDPEELIALIKILSKTIIAEKDLKKERENLHENIKLKTAELILSKLELEKEIEGKNKVEKKLIQAKEKVEVNAGLINLFMDANQSPMFVKDDQFRYLMANDALAVFFEKSRKEILFKTDQELADKKTTPCQSSDQEALNSKTRFTIEEQLGNRIYEITKFPLLMPNNKKGIGGIMLDITEKKIAQKELIKTNKFNEQILNTIPFGMDIVDENGNILFMNPIMKNNFGDFKLGDKCWKHYKDNKIQCEICPLKQPIKRGVTNTIEVEGIDGGKTFEIIHTGMEFNGKKAVMEVFLDVTEKKLSEIKLTEALSKAEEADQLKSAFLANMSHELRTPLNSVIGFSDLISIDTPTEQAVEFGQHINRSGNKLLEIVEAMFDMTFIETGKITLKKTFCNIPDLLYKVEAIIKEEQTKLNKTKINIKLCIPELENKLTIKTDEHRLKQIILNLLSNALKFTEEGFIEFGFKLVGTQDKQALHFYVKDSGIGVSDDKKKIIFDKFRQVEETKTRKYGGVGIGLSISKKLISLMGGEIWVDSELHKGSTFYFTLPIIKPELNKNTNPLLEIDTNKVENKTILIVEDNDINFLLLKAYLNKPDITIFGATNGEQAIELCKTNKNIDLILMDLQMPIMDGYKATVEIKKMNPEIPIIAQTAYAYQKNIEKAKQAGCADYIIKPINQNKLLNMVQNYLKM